MEGMQYFCDGEPVGPGGAFRGHMLPGTLFVVWSLHWLQGSMRHWFVCQRNAESYESQPYYSLPRLPNLPFEPMVKVAMSALGAILELTVHDDGFQWLICKSGTQRAGHFDGDHINNWQHVQMYVCFMVSGMVDLIGWWGVLPKGTEKAFLSLAFAGEAVLMGLHTKEEPLDRFLHQALAVSMILCCIACALEALLPRSYLATCGRVAGVMLQGVLFMVIAHTMFEYHKAWDISAGDDSAPFQYAKVMVTQTMATIVSVYVGLHVAVQVYEQVKGNKRGHHQYTLSSTNSDL